MIHLGDITKIHGGQSLNLNNTVRQNMVVRRLTPLECERLQGFPDHWTDLGEWTDSKGKRHKDADSPRYKALGNSIYLIMVVMRRTDVKTAPGEDSWRSCFT